MQNILLGRRTGLRVSNMAFGTGLLGSSPGGQQPGDVQDTLRAYVEAGGNFFDTSDAYQFGQSEIALGEFLAGRRDDFVVASKYARTATREPAVAAKGSHRKAMIQSVEASLKRLKTDHIDLYFTHFDDGVTPIEEVARGFDDLVRAGKIVYGGFSNAPAWRVAKAATTADLQGWAPITMLQVEYSLLQRAPERELVPLAAEYGLGIMAYSPLAGGLLTGKYRRGEQGRATAVKGSVSHEDAGQSAEVLDVVLKIADQLGATPGQVALAWVMGKGAIPIVGPRTTDQLRENLASANLKLDEEQIRDLDVVSNVPAGYPHELLAKVRS